MELNSCLLSFEKIVSLNRSNTSIDDLPNELVVNILSRLPVKTLVLSTSCVSKKWYFIIKTPSLISAHLSRRSVSDPATNSYIILVHTIFSQVNVFSDHAQRRLIRHPDFNLPFETRSGSHKLIGACNGLVCLTDHSEKYEGRDIYLLNPFINKYRKLSVDSSTYVDLIGEIINSKTVDIRVGFGYSEVEDDHKVVRIIIRHADANRRGLFTPKVEIYSVKSRNWKRVNVSIKISIPSSYDIPVFAHGCLYWHVEDRVGRSRIDYLLCFHLKDEVFSKIKLPGTYHELNLSWDRCIVAAKNDSVAVVLHTFGPNSAMRICLLVLEKKSDGEVNWKEFKYQCAEFSIEKCLGFSSRGRLIMNWGFPEKYLVAIDLDNDNSCVMEKVALYIRNIDDYFYGATNVFESLVLFSDSSCLLSFEKIVSLNGSNTSIDDLPSKLVVNILSRLPVKTLVLSTCVSKKWYFFIKTPSLISAHLSRAASDPATNYYIVLVHTIFSQVNVFSDDGCRLIRHPDFSLPFKTRSGSHKLIGSCNGLICLTDHSVKFEGRDIYLLNPFINKFRKLAVDSSTCVDLIGEIIDSKTIDIRVGFGYSEVEDDYKVVRIIIRHADANRRGLITPKVEIYSVKSRNWKRVNVSIKISKPSSYNIPVFAHGCLYWHVEDWVGRSRMDDYLLCFHLKDEVFSKIKLPTTYHELNRTWDKCIVAAKNDSVAVVLHTIGPNSSMTICLLVLEKKSDGEVNWKEFKYQCAEFSIKKCLGFSSRGRLIMNWGFPEKYLVAIDLDNNNSCVMEKVALYIRNIDDYFYGATNVFESLVLFSD